MSPISEFNPATSRIQAPNFTGASRGGQGTNAFGKLFEGIGDAIGMAAQTADTHIQENIKQDVYKGYDEANAEFGVDSAAVFQQDSPALPNDIQNAGEQLRAMGNAVAQGTLRESHYYARLEAMTRQLRARYPGYREQIDGIVSEVTGTRPANALRRELMSEQQANANAVNEQQGKFMTYVQQNEEYAQPDVYEGLQSGKYTELDVRVYVSKNKQAKEGIQAEKAQSELLAQRKELTQSDAFTLGKKEVGMMVDKVFSDTTTVLGADRDSFNNLITRAQDPSGPGGQSITPEEDMQIRSTFGVLKAKLQDQVLQMIQNPFVEGGDTSYATVLSKAQQDEIMAMATARIGVMEEALANQNWGILAGKQNEINARKAQAVIDVVNGPGGDFLQKAGVIQQLTGPDWFNYIMAKTDGAIDEYKAAVTSLLMDSVQNGTDLIDQVNRLKQSGIDDYRAYNSTFKAFADSIITDKITDQGAERLAMAVFGDKNQNLMAGLKTADDKRAVFEMLTSNAMTEKITKLSKNNPQLWEQYRNWSMRSFTTLFKTTADSVQDSVVSNDMVEITYDPKAAQFVQTFIGPQGDPRKRGLADDFMNVVQTQQSSSAIATINEALRRVAPILQQDGRDVSEELATAFKGMGIDLQARKQPDFWRGLGQAVMDATGGAATLDAGSIQDAFKRGSSATGKAGGSRQGTNPLGVRSNPLAAPNSVFDFRDGMSDVLTDEVGEDDLPGYIGADILAEEKAGLAERIGSLQKAHGGLLAMQPTAGGGSLVSNTGSRVATLPEGTDAAVRATEEAGRATELLSFIGNLEAPLGYNQVYGKNRMAPLDEMTVAQVLNYQKDRVAKGSPSSAVGRYQFIRSTLRGLVRELGLTGEEKFTPELQDRLAIHLLQRRGLNRYLEGRMSLEQFGNSLAKEWASLPVVSGKKKGRSYYAGDGLNKSLTNVDRALEAIQSMSSG